MTRIVFILLIVSGLSACVTVNTSVSQQKDPYKASDSRISLGLAYLKVGQWERARQNLEQAVHFAPKYYRARISLAYYLQTVGEDEQAEIHYRQALKDSPANGDVQNNYGVFLCRQARFSEAQQAFKKAIEKPHYYKFAASYENAALCALKEKDRSNAKRWFAKALDHEPNRLTSTLQLANMEVADGDYKDARLRLHSFHKRYGYRPDTLLTLIELENKAGRPEESEKYVGLLALQFPESREYKQYLENEY